MIREGGTTRIIMPTPPSPRPKPPIENPHEKGVQTFARVFANAAAVEQIGLSKSVFPVGSILVREKLPGATDLSPELLSVMIKRDKGFDRKSHDWEFFVLDPKTRTIRQRESVGSCLKCHAQAKESDFVFKTYLR